MQMRRNENSKTTPLSNQNYFLNAINSGNEIAMEELEKKTSTLLNITKRVDETLRMDSENLKSYQNVMEDGSGLMKKSSLVVKSIVDDPTAMGVMKISFLVFLILFILYFGGKLFYKFFK